MILVTPLEPSLPRLQNWGMTVNGRCLTARISSPQNRERIIIVGHLRGTPDPKYFLSSQQVMRLLKNNLRVQQLTQTTGKGLTTTAQGQQSSNSIPQFIQTTASIHQTELVQHLTQCKEETGQPFVAFGRDGFDSGAEVADPNGVREASSVSRPVDTIATLNGTKWQVMLYYNVIQVI